MQVASERILQESLPNFVFDGTDKLAEFCKKTLAEFIRISLDQKFCRSFGTPETAHWADHRHGGLRRLAGWLCVDGWLAGQLAGPLAGRQDGSQAGSAGWAVGGLM